MRTTLTLTLGLLLAFGTGCAGGDEMAEDDYTNFETWDADGNAEIDESEFSSAYYESGYYDDWDADNSGDLDEDEFDEMAAYDADFDDWDADESDDLSEEEVSAGLFDMWDADDDDTIDENEYNDNFDTWLGDLGM